MSDEELHDELSALLDDELGADARAELERRLIDDPRLADELTRTAEIRSALRDLPEVEPPPGALEEVVNAVRAMELGERRGRRRRLVGSGVAATVLLWLVVASQVTVPAAATTPDVDGAVALHSAMAEIESAGAPGLRSTHFVGGGDRVHRGFGRSDGGLVSVFTEPGRVDWDGLGDGEKTELAGERAWAGQGDGDGVVVVERRGVIVTIVGAGEMVDDPMILAIVDQVSATGGVSERTWLDRMGELVGIG
ncbi:MAG: hypothetical protein AAGD18_20385 [Actinomycetota bacterium]